MPMCMHMYMHICMTSATELPSTIAAQVSLQCVVINVNYTAATAFIRSQRNINHNTSDDIISDSQATSNLLLLLTLIKYLYVFLGLLADFH